MEVLVVKVSTQDIVHFQINIFSFKLTKYWCLIFGLAIVICFSFWYGNAKRWIFIVKFEWVCVIVYRINRDSTARFLNKMTLLASVAVSGLFQGCTHCTAARANFRLCIKLYLLLFFKVLKKKKYDRKRLYSFNVKQFPGLYIKV